jgi:outer membrane protein OmpA-like peptidoglycan-associated protein
MRGVTLIAALFHFSAMLSAQEIIEVTPMDIRPVGEDYAPVPLDSGFVMCSVRETQSTVDVRDASTHKPLSDLYWVPFREGRAETPVLFSSMLTTPVNEGPATFTNGGTTICYTRNLALPKKASHLRASNGQLGLFFSIQENGSWQAPIPFEFNSPKYSILHPTFSATGDTLYFASDMPGGHGGMDLYRSVRTTMGWTTPQNLGIEVNSGYNEAYPRLQPDGTMHFASDRPGGLGKLDIYTTYQEFGDWSLALALPAPINSAGNDFGYAMLPDGYSALMSSDRNGTDRIHLVKRTVPKFRDCDPQQRNNYCFVFKTRAHAATASLPLDHVWDLGDGTRTTGLRAEHCYARPGTYTVRSQLVDRKSGSVFHTLSTHEFVVEDRVQAYVASPDTIRTGRNVVLDPRLSHLPGMRPTEYHWDLGDGSTQQGSRVTHQYRTAGTYTIRLDILMAPDAEGRIHNACNTKQVVVIDRYREHEDMAVAAVYQDAFGKTHSYEYQELPFDHFDLAAEKLSDVKYAVELFASKERISLDDPRFMQLNKFYTVVEQYDPKRGAYVYSVGETNDIEELYKVFRKVKELDFLDAEVFALEVEKLIDLTKLALASVDDLNNGKLVLNTIHFEYKSAKLSNASEDILDLMAALMSNHSKLHMVIEAHTDGVGSRSYNIDLSQQRANAVVEYLAAQGIAPERFVAVGHGKNKPVADNRTEHGRSLNRRVEFRLTVEGEDPTTPRPVQQVAQQVAKP